MLDYVRGGVAVHGRVADWVAQAARLLSPLAEAFGRYVLVAYRIHGDDTLIRVLGRAGAKACSERCWCR